MTALVLRLKRLASFHWSAGKFQKVFAPALVPKTSEKQSLSLVGIGSIEMTLAIDPIFLGQKKSAGFHAELWQHIYLVIIPAAVVFFRN